jgi:hypothetical protein
VRGAQYCLLLSQLMLAGRGTHLHGVDVAYGEVCSFDPA